jgi:ice-binding like protein/putative Ig domain-containing protein
MNRKCLAAICLSVLTICLGGASPAGAQTAPSLSTADPFAVLAGSTVTNTGPTVVAGDLGVSPGSAVTGFPPGTVSGTVHAADGTAGSAQTSLTAAYGDIAGQPCTTTLPSQELGGLTLTPGVYCLSSTAALTGALTLNAQGNSAAVFLFKVGSALTTASASTVTLINSASSCNVFWQVGSSATLGTSSSFTGSILALTSITATTGASIRGRALARNGAVTLDTNNVTSSCLVAAAPVCPAITVAPTTTPNGIIGVAYSQQFTGSGGVAPYAFAVTAGALPAGLTLSAAGVLAGTPTTAGQSAFTITATDANGCTGAQALTASVTTPVPTLPQMFVVLLAVGLAAAGFLRLRQRQRA